MSQAFNKASSKVFKRSPLKHQEATLNHKKLVLEIADTAPKR